MEIDRVRYRGRDERGVGRGRGTGQAAVNIVEKGDVHSRREENGEKKEGERAGGKVGIWTESEDSARNEGARIVGNLQCEEKRRVKVNANCKNL